MTGDQGDHPYRATRLAGAGRDRRHGHHHHHSGGVRPARAHARAGVPPAASRGGAAGWRHLTLPNRTGVLSYPPSLRPLAGDKVAVSAARRGPGGAFQLYLNATPRQGSERLAGWAAFRLNLLRSDDAASAREVAAAAGVKFRGGTGSCVIDDYVTRIGAHHYQEIACLVQGRTVPASSSQPPRPPVGPGAAAAVAGGRRLPHPLNPHQERQ